MNPDRPISRRRMGAFGRLIVKAKIPTRIDTTQFSSVHWGPTDSAQCRLFRTPTRWGPCSLSVMVLGRSTESHILCWAMYSNRWLITGIAKISVLVVPLSEAWCCRNLVTFLVSALVSGPGELIPIDTFIYLGSNSTPRHWASFTYVRLIEDADDSFKKNLISLKKGSDGDTGLRSSFPPSSPTAAAIP